MPWRDGKSGTPKGQYFISGEVRKGEVVKARARRISPLLLFVRQRGWRGSDDGVCCFRSSFAVSLVGHRGLYSSDDAGDCWFKRL